MDFYPTNVLVIGGCGYVGSALVNSLSDSGHHVDVIDCQWFGVEAPRGAASVRKVDAFSCTADDLRPYSAVCFLGGVSADPMADFAPALNYTYNTALPLYIAHIAKEAGVQRVVIASSCAVYAGAPTGPSQATTTTEPAALCELSDESNRHLAPKTCYSVSKAACEQSVSLSEANQFSVICLRMGTVGGYSQGRMRTDLVVNSMFIAAQQKGEIHAHEPTAWRPILDIRDAVSGWMCALTAPLSVSGTFNVVSENATVSDIAARVSKVMQDLMPDQLIVVKKHIETVVTAPRSYRAATALALRVLKFEAMYKIEDTVSMLWEQRREVCRGAASSSHNLAVFKDLIQSGSMRSFPLTWVCT